MNRLFKFIPNTIKPKPILHIHATISYSTGYSRSSGGDTGDISISTGELKVGGDV